MTIKEIIDESGGQAVFSRTWGVPIRTVEDWYHGRNPAKDYIIKVFAREMQLRKEVMAGPKSTS